MIQSLKGGLVYSSAFANPQALLLYIWNENAEARREIDMEEVPEKRLRSLSPTYEPDKHGQYVDLLLTELLRSKSDVACNIALTGHYGSGKSSVLVEVERRLKAADVRVINLSLPSLNIGEARLSTPGTVLDTTNLIQKEIVKQLLYRRKPSATPASRYNRLDTFQWPPAARRAAGASLALTGVALLIGLPAKVRNAFPKAFWGWLNQHLGGSAATTLQWLSLAVTFGLGLGAVIWAQRLFHQRLRLSELAAGPAKVTLSENSTSYFDEYLDEIVYFFQNSGTTVAIFEDLDRFEDPHIFETLRELNVLLNNAEQTGPKPVRFVYAVRDSIFEKLDAPLQAQTGNPEESFPTSERRRLMTTNRTKFFDLVVPIVPFISHKTSRELLSAQLRGIDDNQRPSAPIVDLVSVHLTDMRLIKNICNEFDVFRARILGPEGLEGLTPDRLFASIVYKNIYLDDYEKIRFAEGTLDGLYRAYRDWVTQRATAAREAERVARAGLARVGSSAIKVRSRRLGKRLQDVVEARGAQPVNPANFRLQLAGTNYAWPQLLEPEFWETYLDEPQDLLILPRPGYSSDGTMTFEGVQTLMAERLSPADWRSSDRADLLRKIEEASAEQRVVIHASMPEALQQADKLFDFGGEEKSLAAVADEFFAGPELALARELVHAGFIDENFSLYVTEFPGRGSASAMNFILKSVQPDVMDIEYHFGAGDESDPADIEAVLRSEGSRLLQGQSIYNIEIFDHLLSRYPDRLQDPIKRLARAAAREPAFIDAYLSAGKEPTALVERLSAWWEGVFSYLIGSDAEPSSLLLLDAAILGANPDLDYEVTEEQLNSLVSQLPNLTAVTSPRAVSEAKSIARVLEKLGVKAPELDKVVEPQRSEMVARDLYEISRANLSTILGSEDQLPLDAIKSESEEVYDYMLRHADEYLAAISEDEPVVAIRDADAFQAVLTDVAKANPEALTEVARRAGRGMLIEDLGAFDVSQWPDLARARRLKLSVPVVTQYLNEHGFDEEMVACLVDTPSIDITEGDAGRPDLAIQLLNTPVLEEETKIDLLASLNMPRGSIAAAALTPEGRKSLPRLVAGSWVADDADAFRCLAEEERDLKTELARVSKAMPDYLTSLPLTANDLMDLASARSPDRVKEVLLREYATFEATLGPYGAQNLATWAGSKGHEVPGNVIASLARKAKSDGARSIIKLLGKQAATIDLESMKEALIALGDPYVHLTAPGRDRPKVSPTPGIDDVLQRLETAGIVSKFERKSKRGTAWIDVSKRHS